MTDDEPASMQGEAGPQGRQGEAGVSGRQGEAGTAGHVGAPGEQGPSGTAGEQGQTGESGPRGRAGRGLTRWQILAVAAFVLFAFVVLSVRQEIQQRSIIRNQHSIQKTQYDQCTLRNEATARQNALIDVGIAAEKRRPTPDPKRIKDLTDFKGPLLNCGPPP